MKIIGLFIVLLVTGSFTVSSQTTNRFGIEGQSGFIIAHAHDLKPFADRRPVSLNFSWKRIDLSRKHWEVCNCYHYLGARFSVLDFDESDVLGRAYILSGIFEPVLWHSKSLSVSLPSGIGVTYLTHFYDKENNPENQFFSAPVSFLLFVSPTLEIRLSEKWRGAVSVNYNHISNGGQKKPNRGMNFPQLGVGLHYTLEEKPLPDYEAKKPAQKFWYWFETGVTRRTPSGTKLQKLWVSFAAGAGRELSAINGISAGLEASRDYSLQHSDGSYGKTMSAPFIGHHFRLGRVDFNQRMALYVHRPEEMAEHRFYQRYQLWINAGKGWHVGISLFAHGHVARNLDLRFGYAF